MRSMMILIVLVAVFTWVLPSVSADDEMLFQVYCGDVRPDRLGSPMYFRVYGLYEEAYDLSVDYDRTDFADGLLIPIIIVNRGDLQVKVADEAASSSWSDYIAVEAKRVVPVEDDEEWEGPTCALGMTLHKVLDAGSACSAQFFARTKEEQTVLQNKGDADKIWALVTFDNPELLTEGTYVFMATLRFADIPPELSGDLNEDNLDEPVVFEDNDFGNESLVHKKTDLNDEEGKRWAINHYINTSVRIFSLGKETEAQQFIDKALAVNSQSAPALLTRASFYGAKQDNQQALVLLGQIEQILTQDNDQLITSKEKSFLLQQTYETMGYRHHELGEYEDAEAAYLASIDTLKESAFWPGPSADDSLGMLMAKLESYLQKARNGEKAEE